jgi:hypothetical protein
MMVQTLRSIWMHKWCAVREIETVVWMRVMHGFNFYCAGFIVLYLISLTLINFLFNSRLQVKLYSFNKVHGIEDTANATTVHNTQFHCRTVTTSQHSRPQGQRRLHLIAQNSVFWRTLIRRLYLNTLNSHSLLKNLNKTAVFYHTELPSPLKDQRRLHLRTKNSVIYWRTQRLHFNTLNSHILLKNLEGCIFTQNCPQLKTLVGCI